MMNKMDYSIPIVLIVFNRPELVKKQLERLRKIKPQKLYIVSDGARAGRDEEAVQVNEVRRLFDSIDWECHIEKIYAMKNMGCDKRIVSGLNQVFETEEQAVILEDDCLPHESFFEYCRILLEKYKDNPEIMYISGTKWVKDYSIPFDYGFSYNTGTWGWATWKRAWKEWHWDIEEWQSKKMKWMKGIYSKRFRKNWIRDMERYFEKDSIPWDYVWRFCVGRRLSVFPSVNLIENMGFDENATHTKEKMEGYDACTAELEIVSHPKEIVADYQYPREIEKQYQIPFWNKVIRKLRAYGVFDEKDKGTV
ncbi:glycosyltransferase family 2 protein [bacterium 1XD21-13]|nr:glycosyltransferase family 2 protein [bacterium 1XD21-13]